MEQVTIFLLILIVFSKSKNSCLLDYFSITQRNLISNSQLTVSSRITNRHIINAYSFSFLPQDLLLPVNTINSRVNFSTNYNIYIGLDAQDYNQYKLIHCFVDCDFDFITLLDVRPLLKGDEWIVKPSTLTWLYAKWVNYSD